jgi:hypothetical protein
MRFMVKEKGGVNADVFIEFLKRLPVGETRMIFLIVDRGPAHRAKQTRAFVESLGGRLKLFLFPPYSPDRIPDELVWKHLKGDTVDGMVVTDKADFKSKLSPPCVAWNGTQRRSVSSSKSRRCDMPPEYVHTYGLINTIWFKLRRKTRGRRPSERQPPSIQSVGEDDR